MKRTIGQRSKRPLTVDEIAAQRVELEKAAKAKVKKSPKTAVKDGAK